MNIRMIQVLKEKEIELISKNDWGKRKGDKKKNVIETPCESNTNTVVEENFSSENTYTFWYCCQNSQNFQSRRTKWSC